MGDEMPVLAMLMMMILLPIGYITVRRREEN